MTRRTLLSLPLVGLLAKAKPVALIYHPAFMIHDTLYLDLEYVRNPHTANGLFEIMKYQEKLIASIMDSRKFIIPAPYGLGKLRGL